MNAHSLSAEQAAALAARYVELWNEPDAARRRSAVEATWLPSGTHHVRTLSATGHDALEARVRAAHDKNVAAAGFRFRLSGTPQALHDAVLFHWDMVRPGAPGLEAFGVVLAQLAPDGRIATDYQFVLPTPLA